MNQSTTEQERVVLELLDEAEGPVGAGTVRDRLLAEGFSASEATVGRLLRELDRRGLTTRVGFQGRVLTDLGSTRLTELSAAREQVAFVDNLLKSIYSPEENATDLLVARKAVESWIVRLAAEKGSRQGGKDLEILRERLEEARNAPDLSAEEYREVFGILSKTAGNEILKAIDEVLLDRYVETDLSTGHRASFAGELADIAEAVMKNDPVRAEKTLCRHIDGLIEKRGEGP